MLIRIKHESYNLQFKNKLYTYENEKNYRDSVNRINYADLLLKSKERQRD
jgi:tRNA1(Val) A37 N6-methylase TrmN6